MSNHTTNNTTNNTSLAAYAGPAMLAMEELEIGGLAEYAEALGLTVKYVKNPEDILVSGSAIRFDDGSELRLGDLGLHVVDGEMEWIIEW